jgi:hypothetical protein
MRIRNTVKSTVIKKVKTGVSMKLKEQEISLGGGVLP